MTSSRWTARQPRGECFFSLYVGFAVQADLSFFKKQRIHFVLPFASSADTAFLVGCVEKDAEDELLVSPTLARSSQGVLVAG